MNKLLSEDELHDTITLIRDGGYDILDKQYRTRVLIQMMWMPQCEYNNYTCYVYDTDIGEFMALINEMYDNNYITKDSQDLMVTNIQIETLYGARIAIYLVSKYPSRGERLLYTVVANIVNHCDFPSLLSDCHGGHGCVNPSHHKSPRCELFNMSTLTRFTMSLITHNE